MELSKGKIRWYCPIRQEGYVREQNGESYYFNSSILQNPTQKLKKGLKVMFEKAHWTHTVEVENLYLKGEKL